MLFSFDGRIGRSDYWLKGLLLAGLGGVVIYLPLFALLSVGGALTGVAFLGLLVYLAVAYWIILAVTAKRWHDLGQTRVAYTALLHPACRDPGVGRRSILSRQRRAEQVRIPHGASLARQTSAARCSFSVLIVRVCRGWSLLCRLNPLCALALSSSICGASS